MNSDEPIHYRWCGFCGAKQAFLPERVAALRFPEVDKCPRCGERDWRDEIDELTAPDYRELPDAEGKFPPGWAGLPGTLGMKPVLTVRRVNALLGIDIWRVRSFRANVQIDFDEFGKVLSVTLLNPDQEATDGT